MNKQEIEKVLRKVPSFERVLIREPFPKVERYPSSYIIADKFVEDGEERSHWVAAHFASRHYCEFFDSGGNPPIGKDLIKWMRDNAAIIRYSSTPLQDYKNETSNACGNFCIAFVVLKDAGESMEEIVSFFSKNFACNDLIAKSLTRVFDRLNFNKKGEPSHQSFFRRFLPF